MFVKTIVFLNLRFSNFYSDTLFKTIKEKYHIRLIAIVDQQFTQNIADSLYLYLDQIYEVSAKPKDGFLAEFNLEDLGAIIEKELKTTHDLRIVCADEFNLINAGKLREKYNLQEHTDKDLFLYRNKVAMKKKLYEYGIRVPKYKIINENDTFDTLQEEIGLPFVVKPIDSCGSHGVKVVRSLNDFSGIAADTIVQAEEFIEGKLYHVDSIMNGTEISFISVNEYSCPNLNYTDGFALGSINLDEADPIAIKLKTFAQKSLSILGLKKIVNHMELFMTAAEEIIFLEVSARPPGALVNVMHNINYAINLMDEDFFLQTDLYVDIPQKVCPEKAFWAIFPLCPDRVRELHPPPTLGRCDLLWFVKKGKIINRNECINIVGKAAHAIFYHSDPKILRDNFELIKSHKAIEVECE